MCTSEALIEPLAVVQPPREAAPGFFNHSWLTPPGAPTGSCMPGLKIHQMGQNLLPKCSKLCAVLGAALPSCPKGWSQYNYSSSSSLSPEHDKPQHPFTRMYHVFKKPVIERSKRYGTTRLPSSILPYPLLCERSLGTEGLAALTLVWRLSLSNGLMFSRRMCTPGLLRIQTHPMVPFSLGAGLLWSSCSLLIYFKTCWRGADGKCLTQQLVTTASSQPSLSSIQFQPLN